MKGDGEAADGAEAIAAAARDGPLRDVRMPEADGLGGDAAGARPGARAACACSAWPPGPRRLSPALAEVTPRELEMLRYVARGLSDAEIAREAFVSETTVKTHVARILMKLRLRDRVQAVVFAYENGVVAPGEG